MKLAKNLMVLSFLCLCSMTNNAINQPRNLKVNYAQDVHEHSFVEDKCTCGAYNFEAEKGEIGGTCTDSESGFVLERTSSNSRPTSSGKCVANWSVNGNTITWKFSLNQKTEAALHLFYAPGGTQTVNSENAFKLQLNGERISFATPTTGAMPTDHWYEWMALDTNAVSFNEGNNILVLQNVGYSANIDNLVADFSSEIVVSNYVDNPTKDYKIEAESCDSITGTPTFNNDSLICENASCSGGGLIGNWGNGDNLATWNIYASDASSEVTLTFYVVGISGQWNPQDAMIVRVNDSRINSTDATMPPFDGSSWHDYKPLAFQTFSLQEGLNKIELEANGNYAMNIDYFVITAPENLTISREPIAKKNHYKIEAESCDSIVGTPTFNNDSLICENASCSGGGLIGNWGNGDNLATWNIYADKASSEVSLTFYVVGISGQWNPQDAMIVRVNDTRINSLDTSMPYFDGSSWHDYKPLAFQTFSLKEGLNKIELEANGNYAMNIDYFVLTTPQDVSVSREPISKEHTYKFEAEDADSHGTPQYGNSSFLIENEACSNGKCIGNFGDGDNQLFWYINCSEAVERATIKFYVAAIGSTATPTRDPQDAMWVEVNSTRIESSETQMPTFENEQYYVFKPITMNDVSLQAGSNSIKLEGNNFFSLNIDYMEITIYNGETLTLTNTPPTPPTPPVEVTEHKFVDGRCEECGAYNLEAEDGSIEGVNTDTSGSEDFVFPATSTNSRPTSSDKCVGNFAYTGNTITWNVSSSEAIESFKMSLWIAPCGGSGSINDVISLKINGQQLTFDQATFPGFPGGNSWYNWTELTISNASLVKGNNEIVLTNENGTAFNIDNLVLEVGKDITLTPFIRDKIAPTISVINIDTLEPKTNSEVKFSFTYEDETTSQDKLVVSVKVYFKFGVSGQKKIDCTNNSFMPTEAGEYTIFVTVTDEEGNVGEKTRIVNVVQGEKLPEITPPTENPEQPNKPLSNQAIAGIVLGSVCVVLIGCGVFTFIKFKSKKKE